IARHALTRLINARMTASARAARCSAVPCPYAWPGSAGRTATPSATKVSTAATRSVPEWAASENRPRLCVAMPVTSLSAISTHAAITEPRAVRRWGLTPRRIACKEEGPPGGGPSECGDGDKALRAGDIAVEPLLQERRGVLALVGPVMPA